MSQHDFNIANQGFPSFRTDLNNALVALATTSSGTAEPATTYANQLWYETDTNILHIRDEANAAWLDLMVIDQATGSPSFNAGNVGIGTSSPGAMLELATGNAGLGILAATNRLRFTDNDPTLISGQTTGAIEWYTSDTDAPGVHAYIGTLGANTGAADLTFGTGVGGSTSERMRITSAGNVGIGTTAPAVKLEVLSGGTFDGAIHIGDTGSSRRLILEQTDVTNYTIGGTGTSANTIFVSGGTAGIGTERMRIDSSGNVGIGLATPNDVLDVAAPIDGGIRISESTNNNRFCKITQNTARLTLSADPTNATSTSYINFLVDGSEYMRVHALGVVTMPAVYGDTVTGRDLYIAADGQLGYVSSTRASKTNIQDLSDVSWLYSLNPVSFQYRVRNEDDTYSDEIQPQPEYGLIAEDVELVNPDLVFYDETENGRELRGIQYSRLIAPLLKAIQEQQSLITDLTARVAQLEAN